MNEEEMSDYVEHEGDHVKAGQEEDSHADSVYAYRVARVHADPDRPDKVTWRAQAFNEVALEVTKLGLAATFIYPKKLSPSALEAIRRMGYADEIEVLNRILTHNRRYLPYLHYPVPRWHQPEQ